MSSFLRGHSEPAAPGRRARWRNLVVGGLTLALAACAAGREPVAQSRVVWRSDIDYVRVEPQEAVATAPNDHPVTFSPEQIGDLLRSVQIVRPGQREFVVFGEETGGGLERLFNETEIAKIAPPLAYALKTAGPREDVAFSVSSVRQGQSFGLFAGTRATSARLFQRAGQLNLIFGELQIDYRQQVRPPGYGYYGYVSKIDKLRNPMIPGSRAEPGRMSVALYPQRGQDLATPDGAPRPDWVTLEPAVVLANAPSPAERELGAAAPVVGQQLDQLGERTEQLDAEQRALQQQVERLEQRLAQPAPPAVVAPAVPAQPAPLPDQTAHVEARLAGLKRLLDLGLITDELYRQKAAEILEDL